MTRIVTFGLGGYCENCDPSHDHPLHNIVEIIDEETGRFVEPEQETNEQP